MTLQLQTAKMVSKDLREQLCGGKINVWILTEELRSEKMVSKDLKKQLQKERLLSAGS